MIYFSKFQKYYGSIQVLGIEDVVIDPGIYWLKGVNGSGKSTLLKAIAGILFFNGDIVLYKTLSQKKHPVEYRKVVNFAEAEPIYPEFLTGREMINVFTSAKNAPSDQFEYYIESMNMGLYIDQPVKSYSSGMLKKLSLVLAFLGHPKIILLDEPLITLDSDSLKVLYTWISMKFHRNGTTFILSSHQALEEERLPSANILLVESRTLKSKL
jgi:ABC-2 type transport system ATP-binding protein